MSSSPTGPEAEQIAHLRSLEAIRERCERIYAAGTEDKLKHFAIDESKIPETADFVIKVMNDAYEHGVDDVKFHSRWRHFEPDGVDRVSKLRAGWDGVDSMESTRRLLDLAVVSVLLDAGAGPTWKFTEPGTGTVFNRSEGLGVASFHMFLSGAFSSDPSQPHQADAKGLEALTEETLREAFQVSDETNPLVGARGRVELLNRLGRALNSKRKYFGDAEEGPARFGNFVNHLLAHEDTTVVRRGEVQEIRVLMRALWNVVMDGLQDIWPASRTSLGGANMGDVWPHSALREAAAAAGETDVPGSALVPFHKLSQWLTYSLMEPLEWGGFLVIGMESMTGLAEYRNGGLFVDLGVLTARDERTLTEPIRPDSEVIIEWRALTVALLDRTAAVFREKCGADEDSMPLVKILEAGTWKAGRVIAKAKRESGGPPITLASDGTVF